ncbi:putative reverse transcriptase domain-containing protein [Tanacetum coccineum]
MAPTTRRGPNTPVNNTNPNNMTPESIQAMIDQALLRNSTNGDGSHSSHEDNRRNVQTARPCFYADFMKCQPLNFKGTEGVVVCQPTLPVSAALTLNGPIRTLVPETYAMTLEVLKKKMTTSIDRKGENPPPKKLEIELWNLKVKGNDVPAYTELPADPNVDETIELANELMDQKLHTYAERQSDNKRKADDLSKNNHGHQSTGNTNVANTQKGNGAAPKGNGCFECGAPGHFKRDCPKLKNKDGGSRNAQGWVYAVRNAEKYGKCHRKLIQCRTYFLLNNHYASILSTWWVDMSFISTAFSSLINIAPTPLENCYDVELADGKLVEIDTIIRDYTLNFLDHPFNIDLMP